MIRMKSESGLTLLELLIAISIGVVLLTIGIPSYRYVTNSNRATTEVNALLGDMQYARSEAIKEGQPVTVCPLTGTAPNYNCAANTNTWQGGWIVFSDVNGNANVDTATDVILHVQQPFSVATDSFVSDNNVYAVTYNREGFATGLPATTNGYVTVTLHTSPLSSAWTRCLQLGTYGSAMTLRFNNGSCQ